MIINISNVSQSYRYKGKSAERPVLISSKSVFTCLCDEEYFDDKTRDAYCSEVTCDRELRGFCICCDSLIPDSCEIELICIEEGFKGIGLGRKLLSHALRNMRSLKYKTAYSWINENNTDAIEFFIKFGFEQEIKRRNSRFNNISGDEIRFRIDI